MTFLPIVGRELCAESRRPFNYWLRVLGAGALTIVAALTFLSRLYPTNLYSGWGTTRPGAGLGALGQGQNPFADLGMILFGNLNATLFVALWVLVPLLTADCINREKRESTLGLLFLTPPVTGPKARHHTSLGQRPRSRPNRCPGLKARTISIEISAVGSGSGLQPSCASRRFYPGPLAQAGMARAVGAPAAAPFSA